MKNFSDFQLHSTRKHQVGFKAWLLSSLNFICIPLGMQRSVEQTNNHT